MKDDELDRFLDKIAPAASCSCQKQANNVQQKGLLFLSVLLLIVAFQVSSKVGFIILALLGGILGVAFYKKWLVVEKFTKNEKE
jgi:hypothetical protein